MLAVPLFPFTPFPYRRRRTKTMFPSHIYRYQNGIILHLCKHASIEALRLICNLSECYRQHGWKMLYLPILMPQSHRYRRRNNLLQAKSNSTFIILGIVIRDACEFIIYILLIETWWSYWSFHAYIACHLRHDDITIEEEIPYNDDRPRCHNFFNEIRPCTIYVPRQLPLNHRILRRLIIIYGRERPKNAQRDIWAPFMKRSRKIFRILVVTSRGRDVKYYFIDRNWLRWYFKTVSIICIYYRANKYFDALLQERWMAESFPPQIIRQPVFTKSPLALLILSAIPSYRRQPSFHLYMLLLCEKYSYGLQPTALISLMYQYKSSPQIHGHLPSW